MPLKAKTPDAQAKRLKAFLYGEFKIGKTKAAIGFPDAYIFDCEDGTDWYADQIKANRGVVLQTTDLPEVIEQVQCLISEEHGYRTVIIDPITTLWENHVDVCQRRLADPNRGTDGSEYGRHTALAARDMKRMFNLLMSLDMNVIVTCHAKDVWGENAKKTGITFDGWKKLPYVFDVIFELTRRGKHRMARVVHGSRPACFSEDDEFVWGYDEIAKRFGPEIIAGKSASVPLATPEQLVEFQAARQDLMLKLTPEGFKGSPVDKALKSVDDPSDMSSERIGKAIDYMKKTLNPEPPTK